MCPRLPGVGLATMGSVPDPDAELMLRAKRGDRAAFALLVEKYQQPIVNLVRRTLRDPDEAEDIAQNVFLQAFKSAQRYRATARFSTWLYTIARNLCLNELRRRARHPADPLDSAAPGDTGHSPVQNPDPHAVLAPQALLRQELNAAIELALAGLPEIQRSALLLLRDQELPYEDIAQILHTTVPATKSLIHRARETLKQQLKPYLRSGDWPRPIHLPDSTNPQL